MLTRISDLNLRPAGRWLHSLLPDAGLFAALFAAVLMLGGCGSSDSSNDSGEVVIGLTDAAGDYSSYTVDVESLTLTRQDGTVIETLPISTRVDFAQYTEMTEFLTAATVPSGVYVKASMVLDYRDALIQVEDDMGNIVPVTKNLDLDGNEIETLSMSVHLEDRDKLVIAPGLPAHMTLDFDLKASNSVEFTPTEVIQTVSPFLVADVELEQPKPHRIRGPLESVNVAEHQFKLILRPFYHRFTHDHRRFGLFTVHSKDETVYEIDGENYVGQEGLRKLDTMPQYTATIALGELVFRDNRRVYVADEVYAGSSVPGGDLDVVKGHVLSRTLDTIELKGVTLLRSDGVILFKQTLKVELSDTTRVTKQLSAGSHDIDEISVGQKLTVFGDISGNDITGLVMDATDGLARMHLTTVRGTVVQVDSPLILDLDAIGRLRSLMFNFAGTGVNMANDAEEDAYEINTGALSLTNVGLSEPVQARGFVRAFGMAPEDFDARSLVLVADAKALMMVNWYPASTTAISDITDSSITLDLNGVGHFHHVKRAGVVTDLTTLANSPVLVPNDSGKGVYVLNKGDSTRVFTVFTEFARALADELGGQSSNQLDVQSAVYGLQVLGKFSDDDATMTIRGMRIRLR